MKWKVIWVQIYHYANEHKCTTLADESKERIFILVN